MLTYTATEEVDDLYPLPANTVTVSKVNFDSSMSHLVVRVSELINHLAFFS